MKEYIERESVLDTIGVQNNHIWNEVYDLPVADVAPVVRCHECANHSDSGGNHYCKFWRMYCPDDSDFFCKAGHKKEEFREA